MLDVSLLRVYVHKICTL